MTMRRSNRLAEKQSAKLKNEDHEQPKAKKNRLDDKITNIATLDNGTMVEAFKYLNYYHLANNSFVSKRFRAVIQTHRHLLALLDIDQIRMGQFYRIRAAINIFGKQLSPEAYNEWVIRKRYSKQIPFERQIAENQSRPHDCNVYDLIAYAYNNVLRRGGWYDSSTSVLLARLRLNHENWPLFQHFVCLLTDPFIRIRLVVLAPQDDVLNLLVKAMNPNCNRLQCEQLAITLYGNIPKFINWIKDHVQCNKLKTYPGSGSNCDAELLDFFVTDASCTSEIKVKHYDLSSAILDFVQKFMDYKSCDEHQLVESIRGLVSKQSVVGIKRNYDEFIVKEENDNNFTKQTFEFVNKDIAKKLQLTIRNSFLYYSSKFSLTIVNLE